MPEKYDKLKIVFQSGKFTFYENNILQREPDRQKFQYALQVFKAFSPETLFRKLPEKAVIVFRTDTGQMQQFSELLQGKFPES